VAATSAATLPTGIVLTTALVVVSITVTLLPLLLATDTAHDPVKRPPARPFHSGTFAMTRRR
jgi:hypothetical protein